ncbi:Ig-like domain-containing protein, partial [Staphylococcus caeli]|uniref:Ig-like domain-containing protein n=2 Tax=Staphylococcus caeli TaxID=2201815 RepID=UPI003F574877
MTLDANGNGTITSSNLNDLIEFNNLTPETVGIRIVLKLNQNPNNILTQDAQYDAQGNLIGETARQKEDFTFAGYLTDSTGKLINNTMGTATLTLQDYDRDGLLDRYERQVSLSDPENNDTDGDGKNDGDEVVKYKTSPLVGTPIAADVTTDDVVVTGTVPLKTGAATQTAKVINANGVTVGTATVNADGTFSVSIPKSPAGAYTIAIDSPNYDNDEVGQFNIIDNSKVPAPTINPVDDNDQQLTVNGTAGATITVRDSNNNVIGTVTIPTNGSAATINLNQPLQAGTVLNSTASLNGKDSDVSNTVTVSDATAPDAPTINTVNSESPQISGTAEAGSTVTVTFPDGTTATGTANDEGNYTIDIPTNVNLKGGETLTATATDEAGNTSENGSTTVTDTTAPEAPTVNDVTSDDTTISGTAEPGSTVTVTFPDGTTTTGTADDEGNYTIDIPTNVDLKGGETLTVTSTDKDGNVSEEATTIVTDTTAPEAPTVKDVTSDDTQISGTAEPGSTVTVTFPDGTTATGTADDEGNYTIDIPTNVDLKGGETLTVTSTDKDGNVSEEATTTVTDTTAPEAPTVNDVTSDDTTISGTAEPGSTVTVTFPDGTTTTGTADEEGNYTIDIPTNVDLKGDENIVVTATDKDGNVSGEATTTVTDTTAPEAPTVNDVTSDDTQISGTAEPGSTVTVTFPDGTTGTGTADDEGNYTIDILTNVDLKGGETLTVTSTDKDGNVSEEATTIVTDTTAPEAPTVKDVTSDDTQISGTAEPGSTVTVTFPDGTTATGTADEEGNYTIDIPTNVDLKGDENIVVTATDKDGNVSGEATTIVTDITAPEAPTVKDVTSDDTQISGTAEPGSTVTVTFPDGTTGTGTADDEGNYTIDIPTNVDLKGGETLTVTSTDKDGNVSGEATTTVTDTTAPEAPTVNDVTSDDTQISGTAEPGSTVTVTFPDGTTATGTADEEGNYTIDIPTNVDLKGGETLTVTSTDKDGNVSDEATTTVTDTTAPEAPTVNDVTSDDTQISGTAEPGSTVTVTFPDGTTGTGTADDEGNYTIDIPTNVDLKGDENIVVTATDKDGNVSGEATTTVTDTTAPEAPTVNDVTSDDTQISGTAEPGSTVTVTFPDGTTATGTADDAGNYTVEIPANVDLKGGETLNVTSTDKDGNVSGEATTTVTDTTAPEAPTVKDVTSDDTQISGTAEPGSTVTVTFPDGTTGTGTADDEGNYTIDIP